MTRRQVRRSASVRRDNGKGKPGAQYLSASGGLDPDPACGDVAIARWQQFTGADAALAKTGETLAKRLAA